VKKPIVFTLASWLAGIATCLLGLAVSYNGIGSVSGLPIFFALGTAW
jgi:hypothetical protein